MIFMLALSVLNINIELIYFFFRCLCQRHIGAALNMQIGENGEVWVVKGWVGEPYGMEIVGDGRWWGQGHQRGSV